jgi:hypothetical protein
MNTLSRQDRLQLLDEESGDVGACESRYLALRGYCDYTITVNRERQHI